MTGLSMDITRKMVSHDVLFCHNVMMCFYTNALPILGSHYCIHSYCITPLGKRSSVRA